MNSASIGANMACGNGDVLGIHSVQRRFLTKIRYAVRIAALRQVVSLVE